MDTREELKEQLDSIREEHPNVAQKVWELFKLIKKPETVKETVVIRDEKLEQELEEEVKQLKYQLSSKAFQIKSLTAEVDYWKSEILKIQEQWNERFTVRVSEATIEHPYFTQKDDILLKLHRKLTEEMIKRLPMEGAENLSFAKKQMFLHIGFSEFWLLKSLSCKTIDELVKTHFPVKIILDKEV